MITEKKVVLIVKDEHAMEDIKYEAIEIITNASEVPDVWRCNKTPAMLEKNAKEVMEKFPCVILPEFIFGSEHFIAFCHNEGFECGEFISGHKFDTSKERCFLCAVGSHKDKNRGNAYSLAVYNQITPEINDIIIYETKNFYVKIEYGCMKKGMLMICPKKHVLSAARLPNDQIPEYEQVKKDVEFLLKAVYGNEPVIFFEHGASPSGFTSHKRSIVHAHTHVAWGITIEQKYQDMVCLKSVSNIGELSDTKYFSYQEGTDGELLAVWDKDVYVQRQYPRQVIGLELGIPNELTNWRKEAFMDNIKATFKDIYDYLKVNREFLCKRIACATKGFVEGYPKRKDR